MNGINTIIENLILGMRDGKAFDDIFNEELVKDKISDTKMPVISKESAVDLAQHIVDLYDGKFPVDHLDVGDICIDAFRTSPCIITNINDRSIHVLYFNGKTHKFKRSQERYFKKTGMNFKYQLQTTIDNFHQSYFVRQAQDEIKEKIQTNEDNAANDEDRNISTPYNEQILNINKED